MGPYDLMRQLARRHSVLQLLAQPDLSTWARAYWQRVYDTIALDEQRYAARAAYSSVRL